MATIKLQIMAKIELMQGCKQCKYSQFPIVNVWWLVNSSTANKSLTWDLLQSQLTPTIGILIFQKIANSPESGKIKEIDKVD